MVVPRPPELVLWKIVGRRERILLVPIQQGEEVPWAGALRGFCVG